MVEMVAESKQNESSETETETKKLKVGLIMPISHTEGYPVGHWGDVRKIIEEALSEFKDYKVEVSMVSEAEDSTLIQKTIIQRIYSDDIVIVDVSSKNPNVMFELGVRLAFDRPFILLKDDSTDYVFDISSIYHINYPRDLRYKDIVDMKNQLKLKLDATYKKSLKEESMYLKDFGTFKVANLQSTELPMMDYLQKMFSDVKREIREVKPNKVESKLTYQFSEENRKKRDKILKDRINLIVREYIANNDVGDGSELFSVEHEVLDWINRDNVVKSLTEDKNKLYLVLSDVLDDLGYLPF
ncbi:UNVERIFIED_CONTAM: hypothetical protein BJ099_108112 [Lysinibacillus xylanilyticus]|uniref:hypothetical protein n=1 Tax=Lysinibacillus xylanilyticus TaxID=582475 RepID=UPI00069F0195|nr:hypothetical protein [Lysinibacillus xylanilyticus]